MQWGAPGGPVNVFQYVVEIIPNVSGEVIDVPVEPLVPLKSGDVLFRIDPVPFQATVDQLRAQLAAAIQNVEQLQAAADAAEATVTKTNEEIEIKKTEIDAAQSAIAVAESEVERSESRVEKATNLLADLEVQVAAGKREFDRQKKLLAENAGSQADTDKAEVQYTGLVLQRNSAESDLQASKQALTGSRAGLDVEKANARSVDVQLKQLLDAELPRVKSLARESKLAAESMIGDEHTSVATARALLASAEYDLEQTVVRAPSNGHVAFVTLRPGQRVANLPLRSWMAFIDHEKYEVTLTVNQYAIRHVKPGQKAEVTLKLYPGRVFPATVNRIAYITSAGQLAPSGTVASTEVSENAEPYGVVLELDDKSVDPIALAGGAKGSAAIYTESMTATHVIRRVMIRMDAWMNYLIP